LIAIPMHSGTKEVQNGINGDLENINCPSGDKTPLLDGIF